MKFGLKRDGFSECRNTLNYLVYLVIAGPDFFLNILKRYMLGFAMKLANFSNWGCVP